jgi:capsular exopolysaccharide synthesis family protein
LVRSGKRTLLIDADLRRPSLHLTLGATDEFGLSDVLTGQARIRKVIQQLSPKLGFISAGLNPDEGLQALGCVDHSTWIKPLLNEFDFIVLDTPPVLSGPDGLILGSVADGVLLAVRSGVSRSEEVSEASHLLEQVGCRVLGAVLNGVATSRSVYYYRARRSEPALPMAEPLDELAEPTSHSEDMP